MVKWFYEKFIVILVKGNIIVRKVIALLFVFLIVVGCETTDPTVQTKYIPPAEKLKDGFKRYQCKFSGTDSDYWNKTILYYYFDINLNKKI